MPGRTQRKQGRSRASIERMRQRILERRREQTIPLGSVPPQATVPAKGKQEKKAVVPSIGPPPVPAVTVRLPEEQPYIPAFLREYGQQRPADISTFLQRYRSLTGWKPFQVYPGPSLAERIGGPLTEPIVPGGFGEILREAYQPRGLEEIFGPIRSALGIGEAGAVTTPPEVPFIKPQRTYGARRYSAALRSLYQGVRPPFLGFGIQEFMGLTDEQMEKDLGYTKVPGGWVARPTEEQSLANVYGGPSYGQPETITISYDGGGGGGVRRQSSHLINWRI